MESMALPHETGCPKKKKSQSVSFQNQNKLPQENQTSLCDSRVWEEGIHCWGGNSAVILM